MYNAKILMDSGNFYFHTEICVTSSLYDKKIGVHVETQTYK